MKRTSAYIHRLHGVVLHKRARRTEQDDSSIRGPGDGIVRNRRIATRNRDTVRPLLERIGPTRANVVVPNDSARTLKCPLEDM